MAELPKIDSEGLRLAKRESAKRISSVVRVSKIDADHLPRYNCAHLYEICDYPRCPGLLRQQLRERGGADF